MDEARAITEAAEERGLADAGRRRGPATGQVHQALPNLFPQWAVLRPSWFMQNFTGDHAHAWTIRQDGTIRTTAEEGRVGFVDADDIAAVLTDVTGRTVTHSRLTYEQMRDRPAADIPAEFAAMLAGMTAPSPTAPRTAPPTPSNASPAVRRAISARSRKRGDGQVPESAPCPRHTPQPCAPYPES